MTAEFTFSEGRALDSLPFYFNIINSFREIALLQIGKAYFFENQFREAATNFDILLLEYPNSLYSDESLFLKGESLFRLGEMGPALAALDSLTQKRTAPAWQLLALIQTANIHLLRNAGEVAEPFFRRVIELFPNHPLSSYAAFQLGNLQFLKKNIAEAMHFYSLVLKGNMLEFVGEAYFRMGEIFYQQEKYEKALKNFETAIEHFKEASVWFFLTHLEIGNLQRRWGKYEEAKKSYRIILDQSQDEGFEKRQRNCWSVSSPSDEAVTHRSIRLLRCIPRRLCRGRNEFRPPDRSPGNRNGCFFRALVPSLISRRDGQPGFSLLRYPIDPGTPFPA